ncbi:MAG: hypothetical protein LBT59_16685 [Clostridiales bacterium]|nr:hypothetical protein [Clostridiales bacterium]
MSRQKRGNRSFFLLSALLAILLRAGTPSAYPKIPKWQRKNPGERFNAGFFRCLGYNFGICTYSDSFVGFGGDSFTPESSIVLYARWRLIESAPVIVPPPSYYYPTPTPKAAATPAPVLNSETIPSPSVVSVEKPPVIYAEELYNVGLFVGTGTDASGSPIFDLDNDLTRMESLVLLIRLLGLEKDALGTKETHVFEDVPDWGAKYASFAYEIGLTVGVNDTHSLFAPNKLVTKREFAAFMLRVLQYYEKSGDFRFEESVSKAKSVGILGQNETQEDEVLRSNAVLAMVRALLSPINNSKTKLLAKLVQDGAVSFEGATGFIAAIVGK